MSSLESLIATVEQSAKRKPAKRKPARKPAKRKLVKRSGGR